MTDWVKISCRLRHLPIAALLALVWACSSDDGVSAGEGGRYVTGIAAAIATRSDVDNGTDAGGGTDSDNKSFNIDELIPYSLAFDENTILQVSQQATNLPPFLTPEATYDYKYITSFVDNGNAWDDENSYNFRPYENDEPLEWNKISTVGSYNGGFAMYCMYFPIENSIRSNQLLCDGGPEHGGGT